MWRLGSHEHFRVTEQGAKGGCQPRETQVAQVTASREDAIDFILQAKGPGKFQTQEGRPLACDYVHSEPKKFRARSLTLWGTDSVPPA